MFGHQDDDQQTLNDQAVTATANPQDGNWNAPPLDDGHNEEVPDPVVGGVTTQAQVNDQPVMTTASSQPDDTAVVAGDDELLGIKQQALNQLSPLVSHLDQPPEERFRTLMMMIQASDNQLLVKDAYETAQQISDEREKAQALLDIVNEINYFTHKGQDS